MSNKRKARYTHQQRCHVTMTVLTLTINFTKLGKDNTKTAQLTELGAHRVHFSREFLNFYHGKH